MRELIGAVVWSVVIVVAVGVLFLVTFFTTRFLKGREQ